ncbi:urease accessory protein UreH domain-containing protein [Butyrivibrio sp. M55]|uniref:urease accessory protein UreH domain-containing protein n=1 Tax=Butyrivibrio sp. M55 TaxID=1855323 RepID=UPI0008F1649B|nr:sulfite exporter TauE/SafE family protein [Butyrivibrio sp. M55]SFU92594.1 Sulfite exporter TauE/SafE [Butyrivibrio sp. M55]
MAMKHIILTIDGMSCINCQNKIEKKIKQTKGISNVNVSYSKGTADFNYDPEKISVEKISDIIDELGYRVVGKRQKRAELLRAAETLSFIVLLYILLQRTGILNMLVPAKLADSGMSYGMLFVVGVLTSVHCVAMCGGINLSQSIRTDGESKTLSGPLLYNIGRVISYTVIGFILGMIGMLATGGNSAGIPIALQGMLKILAGIIMVIMGINILGIIPGLRRFQIRIPTALTRKINSVRRSEKRPLIVGLLNGLMPCGPLMSMQIIALASGNPVAGALSMLMFSLGTVPLMLGLGSFISAIGKKYTGQVIKAGGILVVVLGLAMFTQGLGLARIKPVSDEKIAQTIEDDTDDSLDALASPGTDEVQLVESTLELGKYPEITVYSGIPVRWTINASEDVINGCNYRMLLTEYDIVHDFSPGENVIEFTPGEPGTVQYSCWMGMVYGKINIVEKTA